jgi:hypothetical protein
LSLPAAPDHPGDVDFYLLFLAAICVVAAIKLFVVIRAERRK